MPDGDNNNNGNNYGEFESLPDEVHDIKVTKIDDNTFRIVFGTKTDIEGLFSAIAEIDVDRKTLDLFLDRASEALGDGDNI